VSAAVVAVAAVAAAAEDVNSNCVPNKEILD